MTFQYSDATPIPFPALELTFLPLSLRKGIPTPEIAFVDSHEEIGCSGYYDAAGGHCGRLVAVNGEDCESTLAHEYRHHWQRHAGCFDSQTAAWVPDDWQDDYWTKIRDYFSFQLHEYDALLFELALTRPRVIAVDWLIHCQRCAVGLFAAPSAPRMQ